ncbi:PTS fructose transporter subunit IIC [Erysipelothrix aquatica]|uniref:PTS fructose transporter subunit IIC n=1 Tax=Erysipelothrix aquatica TaxID=2683714 RepID=UPI00135BF422|nr:PTS fructose transporter subunit IIC [Erysipelothrix aquatica]
MEKKPNRIFKDLTQAFNTGVSYMMPAVVVGGIFLAAALATGEATDAGMVVTNPFFQNLLKIGEAGFAMMIPILSGYIAYSLAGKPGLIPGMITGFIANNPVGANNVSTGFLGAMLVGILAGYFARWMKTWNVNNTIRTIMPILIIPMLTTFVVSMAYMYVLAAPLGSLMAWLMNLLSSLEGSQAVILGVIIGAMTAIDMGGPINKTASAFTLALMAEGIYGPNGAFRIAVAIPPLGVALSTFISKKKYTTEEKNLGASAFFMGLIGITEGAIPFAVKSIKTVLPAIIIGSAVGSGLGMIHNVEVFVPHGGLIVIAAATNKLWFVLDMLIGACVTAGILHVLRPDVEEK